MNLIFKKVSPGFPDMEKLDSLNKEAFPPAEYLSIEEQIQRAETGLFDLWAIYDEDAFIGFMFVMTYKKMAYLFFFAIGSALRSNGYGGTALLKLKEIYPHSQHVVDMEALDEAAENLSQRISRRNFYLRNGYRPTGYFLLYFGVTLEVLCRDNDFDVLLFEEQLSNLHIKGFDPKLFKK